jgi:hypothetical protein
MDVYQHTPLPRHTIPNMVGEMEKTVQAYIIQPDQYYRIDLKGSETQTKYDFIKFKLLELYEEHDCHPDNYLLEPSLTIKTDDGERLKSKCLIELDDCPNQIDFMISGEDFSAGCDQCNIIWIRTLYCRYYDDYYVEDIKDNIPLVIRPIVV